MHRPIINENIKKVPVAKKKKNFDSLKIKVELAAKCSLQITRFQATKKSVKNKNPIFVYSRTEHQCQK